MQVLRMLAAKPMVIASVGVAAGVGVFLLLVPTLGGMLYGVSAHDPIALTCAAATVLGISGSTTLVAACAALRVSPASVLREE